MTNPINYCIQKIKNEIPNEILQIAATEDLGFYNNSITLDEKTFNKSNKSISTFRYKFINYNYQTNNIR